MMYVVVLPDGAGEDAHETLERGLVSLFGGVSVYQGRGVWASPEGVICAEGHVRYEASETTVAIPPEKVYALAREAGRLGNQQEVYVGCFAGRAQCLAT